MCNINRMATKKEFEEKREYARLLFMQGETQKVIAEKVGVSAVTINKWVAENGWQEQRAAANITRPELVNKLLHTIDKLIEQVNESDDPEAMAGLGAKLAKLSASGCSSAWRSTTRLRQNCLRPSTSITTCILMNCCKTNSTSSLWHRKRN